MGRASEVRAIKKAKTNIAKSRVYSKYGKLIYKAAKNNPNSESNPDLASVIKSAKRAQCTKEIIERALKKAQTNNDIDFKNVSYEGFISKSAYIIIEASTDNMNRTSPEIKSAFTKSETKIASPGSVSIYFSRKSILEVEELNEEQIYEIALNNEIEIDSVILKTPSCMIIAPADQMKLLTEVFEDKIITSQIKMIPNDERVKLDVQEQAKYDKLISLLNECYDIDDIYTNIKGEE